MNMDKYLLTDEAICKILYPEEPDCNLPYDIKWMIKTSGFKMIKCFLMTQIALIQPAIDEAVKKTAIYKQALEDDATDLWNITNELKKEIKRHEWICEGRGCYSYDDDQYRQETRMAFDALLELIKNVQRPASNRFHKIIDDARKQSLNEVKK